MDLSKFENYLKEKQLSDNTISLYLSAVSQYLRDWDISELREWKKAEAKRVSPNTLNSSVRFINNEVEM